MRHSATSPQLLALLALGATSVGVFQTRAQANEEKQQIAQQQVKDVAELRAEMKAQARKQELSTLRLRITFLNGKTSLTTDEKDELEFSRELVKKLQAEALQE